MPTFWWFIFIILTDLFFWGIVGYVFSKNSIFTYLYPAIAAFGDIHLISSYFHYWGASATLILIAIVLATAAVGIFAGRRLAGRNRPQIKPQS